MKIIRLFRTALVVLLVTTAMGSAAEQEGEDLSTLGLEALRTRSEKTRKILVRKANKGELEAEGIAQWSTWGKEASTFPWHYDRTETCYILEGRVTVTAGDQKVSFGPGDIVVFPAGLDCVWHIETAIRKHYRFK